MLLALDVHYKENFAQIVAIIFDWFDEQPQKVFIDKVDVVNDYIPGEFYKRELPCLLKAIKNIDLSEIGAIIIDGHVYVEESKFGLGGKLYESLNKKVPVIGIAKNSFHKNKNTVEEVFRGKSKNPLYVSTIGIDLIIVVEKIKEMKGEYRIPTILKKLDMLSKS